VPLCLTDYNSLYVAHVDAVTPDDVRTAAGTFSRASWRRWCSRAPATRMRDKLAGVGCQGTFAELTRVRAP
jgi:hypothetical protein